MALKIHICAVGRLRSGPERTLLEDYLDRFDKTGRAMGLGPVKLHEVEDRKGGGMAAEAQLLAGVLPKGARICTMDERGKLMSSPEFAQQMARLRDDGAGDLAFIIGGADGIDPSLRSRAIELFAQHHPRQHMWPNHLTKTQRHIRAAPQTRVDTVSSANDKRQISGPIIA